MARTKGKKQKLLRASAVKPTAGGRAVADSNGVTVAAEFVVRSEIDGRAETRRQRKRRRRARLRERKRDRSLNEIETGGSLAGTAAPDGEIFGSGTNRNPLVAAECGSDARETTLESRYTVPLELAEGLSEGAIDDDGNHSQIESRKPEEADDKGDACHENGKRVVAEGDDKKTEDSEEESDEAFSDEEEEEDSEDLDDISDVVLTSGELLYIASGEESDYIRERKRGKKRLRQEKKEEQQYEHVHELKVQAALASLQENINTGVTVPIGPIDGGRFELYSAAYLDHYYVEVQVGKSMTIGKIFDDMEEYPETICGPNQLSAEVHIYPKGHLSILPFDPPKNASLVPTIIKTFQGWPIEVTFLGGGVLKLSIDLDLVMGGKPSMASFTDAPEKLEFFGIWQSHEERKRLREESWRKRRQISSPRDSIASRLGGWDDW